MEKGKVFATFSFLPSLEEQAAERAKDAMRFKPQAMPCSTCDHQGLDWSAAWNPVAILIAGDLVYACKHPDRPTNQVTGKKASIACRTMRSAEFWCGHKAKKHSTNEANRIIWIQQHGDVDATTKEQ